ncbi:HNH endonuclease signature motif containing protein [Streptomyces sp. NPDC088775]|uniref:HNH endonuclease signature motif containing protein n=1 Tax=Streptomyces sp. NPDC088775 TaxID=3365896 RepID=UPI00381BC3EE
MTELQCIECGTTARKFSRDLCPNCYARWWKAQKRAGIKVRRPSLLERFHARCSPRPNGCIHWTGYVSKFGYGSFSVAGGRKQAHRVAYELFVGPIPDGAHVDHVCHNRDLTCGGGNSCQHRRCVNPDHLEPVTILENLRRSPLTPYGKPPKSECIRGHELSEENTYVRSNGARLCRQCTLSQQQRKRDAKPPKPERQFCRRGHRMTDENTYHYGNRRVCRQCKRDADKAAYWQKRREND